MTHSGWGTSLSRLEGPIWVAFGIVIAFLSYRTGIGSFNEPGAGFVALASGLFMIAIGTVMALFRADSSPEANAEARPAMRGGASRPLVRLILPLALLVLYALLLEPLGYLVATFILMSGLFFDPERPRLAGPLFASLASVAATYTVFEVWLKTQLPRGVFPWW